MLQTSLFDCSITKEGRRWPGWYLPILWVWSLRVSMSGMSLRYLMARPWYCCSTIQVLGPVCGESRAGMNSSILWRITLYKRLSLSEISLKKIIQVALTTGCETKAQCESGPVLFKMTSLSCDLKWFSATSNNKLDCAHSSNQTPFHILSVNFKFYRKIHTYPITVSSRQ